MASASAFACSGGDDEAKKGTGTEGAGGELIFEPPPNFGSGSTPGAGSTGSAPIDGCGYTGSRENCRGQQYAGEQIPLDIYVMFDQSCSMSCPAEQTGAGLCCRGGPNPRIDHVRSALRDFANSPASAGIGIGVGYFGYMEAGQTSCDPSDYSRPDVRIGALPGNAQAFVDSLGRAEPTGETPTGAAIRGACTYASQWASKYPGHKTVVLLVTDGFPEAPVTSQSGGCTPSIEDAVVAATGCASANLPIYVIGVGQRLTNLNEIAAAGGTDQAYLVEGGDVSGAVLQALNEIRAAAAIPCTLQAPTVESSGGDVNYQTVNLAFCDGSQRSQTFYYVNDQAGCDPQRGGWYYDDPQSPKQIELCPVSCGTVSAPGGRLVVSVGCDTEVIVR